MKDKSLVGRAFGRVTSSQKAIDKLIGSGFKTIKQKGKSQTLIKNKD